MIDISKQLNRYTKLSSDQRRKTLKWLSRQNEELLLVTFERQKDEYFKLSKASEDKSLLYLSAFYISSHKLYSVLNGKQGKNRKMNIDDVQDATKLQAKQFKKQIESEKWNKLLNLKSKILKLKDDEGLSFRELSEFLLRYHRLHVSHTYIANFYSQTKEDVS